MRMLEEHPGGVREVRNFLATQLRREVFDHVHEHGVGTAFLQQIEQC
jgi:hypothetical protein